MSNFAFAPSTLSVEVGATVQWTNHDTAPHDVTVTSGPVAVHSPMLTTGQSWQYHFTVAGTYSYICSIHPDMHATLTVHAAPAPTTAAAAAAAAPRAAPPAQASAPAARPAQPRPTDVARAPSAAGPSAGPSAAAPGTPSTADALTSAAAAAPVAATGVPASRELKPLLVVAGIVVAVATFCLLLLASSPDAAPDRDPAPDTTAI